MINANTLVIIILLTVLTVSPAVGQNPFTRKDSPAPTMKAETPSASASLLTQITIWQFKLKQTIAALIRRAKTEHSLKPLALLICIAFGYGVIHAAGPGHGKAVAASYTLSRRRSLAGGILFGNLIALSHGLTAALLVLFLRFILQSRLLVSLENVSQVTQRISYALIALLGIVIIIHALRPCFKKTPGQKVVPPSSSRTSKSLIPAALAVGMVPCPGVVMIMLFCLSMNMLGLGLLLTACMSAGMALTITLVIITTMIFRNISLQAFSKRRKWAEFAETAFELMSGLLMAFLGLVFLYTTY